jgi:peptide-methionine (R)-S-oxide reductase
MARQFTDEELRKKLTPEQYGILREKGTEAPFTGKLLHNKEAGTYVCPVCGNELFMSDKKFDSGSGWPSFYEVASTGAVKLVEDNSGGMRRVEVECAKCGSHLGHVFNDAPDQPTGQRFCINSASLEFLPGSRLSGQAAKKQPKNPSKTDNPESSLPGLPKDNKPESK